jgi:hypothetical protein
VTAGTWHAFHLSWIAEIQLALNGGLLPASYYAQAEQFDWPMEADADIQILQSSDFSSERTPETRTDGGLAVGTMPLRIRQVDEAEMQEYVLKRRTLALRHASGDHIVALIELVSPGNKASAFELRGFVANAVEAQSRGYHLLIIDLFPPGPRYPEVFHRSVWVNLRGARFDKPPPDEPLTLASYSAGPFEQACIKPTAVGRELIDMPLFLEPEFYVNVPLEATYMAAYRGVPQRWKRVLDQGMQS